MATIKKKKLGRFTFKTTRASSGLVAVCTPPYHTIKLKKISIGAITHKTWDIRLRVMIADINEDGNPNCKFKWITLTHKSSSIDEAKIFLNDNIEELSSKYTFPEE